jgi:Uma2 family endonuclease
MQSARKHATYADLLALPEDVRAEILDGEIRVAPSPLPRHARAQRAIGSLVGGPYDDDDGRGGPGGWWILLEVDIELEPHQIVRPDLSGWRRERLVDPWDTRPLRVVPDWICEIASPSNARQDRVEKRALYAAQGVRHYWLVDPEARMLEALQLEAGRWLELGTHDDSATARIAPFDAIEIEIARLFPPEG